MAATRVGRWAAYGDTPTYLIKRARCKENGALRLGIIDESLDSFK